MKTQAVKFITIIVLLMGALTGCGQSSQSENKTSSGESTQIQTNSEEVNQQVEVSEEEATNNEANIEVDTTNEEVEQATEEKVFEASGTFVGLIDNHTIEVTVDGVPTAYQLSNEVKDQVELLDEGNEITFSFLKDPTVGQKTIIKFK